MHAVALWNSHEFMEDLFEIAIDCCKEYQKDHVELLIDELLDFEIPKVRKPDSWNEDDILPFN
ncbi:MAG: hypothetical protein ACERKN_10875 [Velocimicrobium sp.]